MQKIKIWHDNNTHISVDGNEIRRITGYELKEEYGVIPKLNVSVIGEPCAEIEAEVSIRNEGLAEQVRRLQRYRLSHTYDREYVALDEVLRVLGCQQ